MLNRKKRMKRNEDELRDSWNNIKDTNVHLQRGPRRREKRERKGAENIFEGIIAKNFPSLKGSRHPSTEAQRVPVKDQPVRDPTKTNCKAAKLKTREKMLKAARGKQ